MRRRTAATIVVALAGAFAAHAGATAPSDAAMAEPPSEPCPVAAANLFAGRSWLPPPPPPRKPEPPKAPPLPFTYLGQLEEEGSIAVFLRRGDSNLVVRRGDVIDNKYRVDDVTPMRATFVFLPLKQAQHLTLRTRP
jgi:hypothetical protein